MADEVVGLGRVGEHLFDALAGKPRPQLVHPDAGHAGVGLSQRGGGQVALTDLGDLEVEVPTGEGDDLGHPVGHHLLLELVTAGDGERRLPVPGGAADQAPELVQIDGGGVEHGTALAPWCLQRAGDAAGVEGLPRELSAEALERTRRVGHRDPPAACDVTVRIWVPNKSVFGVELSMGSLRGLGALQFVGLLDLLQLRSSSLDHGLGLGAERLDAGDGRSQAGHQSHHRGLVVRARHGRCLLSQRDGAVQHVDAGRERGNQPQAGRPGGERDCAAYGSEPVVGQRRDDVDVTCLPSGQLLRLSASFGPRHGAGRKAWRYQPALPSGPW